MADNGMKVNVVAFTIREIEGQNYRRLPEKKLVVLLRTAPDTEKETLYDLPEAFVQTGERVPQTASRLLKERLGMEEAWLALNDVSGTEGSYVSSYWTLFAADAVREFPEDRHLFDVIYHMEERESRVRGTRCESLETWRLELVSGEQRLSAVIRVSRESDLYNETLTCSAEKCSGIREDCAIQIARSVFQLRHSVRDTLIAFKLMPETFTLTELQKVYETILDTPLLTANFRRKISPYVIGTDEYAPIGGHHPSLLYRRNIPAFIRED
ncbi:MAG: hypothetical protein Q4G19_04415 [Clostridia bacterium]|nr:hypothetical protein [Clostridia bacterium]